MPLVSIIIPVHNGQETICRAVQCALDQTVADVEVVVVDDGSADGTASLVRSMAESDARVVPVKHAQNKGRLEARRSGINAATGVFCLFLDADDELLPDACEQAIRAHDGAYDIVQFDFDYVYAGYVPEAQKRFTANFSKPAATTATGAQVTHLVFRDRATTWSLCGKLMLVEQVRQAFAQLPEQGMQRAEDACVFFVLSTIAKSYRGLPGYRGYVYHIDEGGTSAVSAQLSLEEFGQLCRYADAMDAIEGYLESSGKMADYATDYRTVRHEHCLALADKLLSCVAVQDRPQALDALLALWPAEEAVSALAEAGWEDVADTVCSVAEAKALQVSPREVRTVGVYHYAMRAGGAEKVAAWLCNLYKRMGCNVVFFADEPAASCNFDLPEGVPWVQLPESFGTKRDAYAARAALIAEAVRTFGIDAFVHHQWWNPLLSWDMLLLKALDVPFALFNHLPYQVFFCEGHPWEYDAVRTLRYVDGLVVLSESDVAFWSEQVPRVWLTANPATVDPTTALQAPLNSHEVLWVGRLSAHDKQPAEALEVFARIAQADEAATLTMVGEAGSAGELAALKARARKLGVMEKVQFIGGQDNVVPFYERAGVLLVTSTRESWGLALVEAKACGLPAVMYTLPPMATTEGNRGIVVVDQGDADGAARAILELFGSQERREQLGREAHQHACELAEFDFEGFWQEVFAQLGQGSPSLEGFEAAYAKWDMVVRGAQEGLQKALYAPVGSYVKRKGYAAARNLWHRIRP